MELLTVVVKKRDGLMFSGLAKSVTSWNEKGTFDILPKHTNFVSVIKKRLEIIRQDKQHTSLPLSRGVLRVRENQVEIYVGI